MKIAPIHGMVLRQYCLMKGSVPRFLMLFTWVAVDMIVWGFMSRYMNSIASPGYNFVVVLLGAVLLWDVFIRIMQGTTMAYMEDSWTRNLFNVFASPLTTGEYLAGLVLSGVMTSIVGLVVMMILAMGVFGLSFFSYGAALFPFLLIIFMFGIALGILGCALLLRLGPSGEWLIWPIPAVISPFVAVFYPLSTLPEWMQVVGHGIPATYVFENIRAITTGGAASWSDLAFGIGLSVFYIIVSCLVFLRIHRRAIMSGAIARYSAESY